MLYTYSDAVESLIDYLGGSISDVAVRDCKRAVHDAYRDLANAHTWTYLYDLGRIITSSPYTAGTMTYLQSSGTYPRQVTLATGTWPSWAGSGFIRIDTVNFRVDQRISDTVVTLTETLNPGVDIPVSVGFTLYQDTYLLPADYIAQDQAMYERNFCGMTYTHPRDWAYENRYRFAEGVPEFYTIMGNRQIPGRLFLYLFPFPSETKTIDFIYKRRPRALTHYRVNTGTSALSLGSTVVSGSGTSWDSTMVGSTLRVSGSAQPPTGYTGPNPSVFESIILAVTSPTSLTTYDPSPVSISSAVYLISDPIDIEIGAMLNGYKRGCEMQISMNRTLKDKPSAKLQYRDALVEAKEADSRSFAGRHAGPKHALRLRLRDMPSGPDM